MKQAIPVTIPSKALAAAGLAALACVACGPAPVQDNGPQPQRGLRLVCQQCPDEAWTALRAQAELLPSSVDAPAPLTITLRMTKTDPHFLEANLVLQQGEEPPHVSTPMRVAVMDSAVGPESYDQLVKALFAANAAYLRPAPNKELP